MESKIFASRYELLERIGMGGMAVVYKAKDNLLNRNVAVKILRDEFKENEDFIRRFKSESQAAACLSHQNIVQIYDVGEEDGMHYIVMELLEGITLKQHMNLKGGRLSPREALNFSMQICRALEHAHSKYVVHRDIKPQNIVITESGKLKVADFGIARAANNTTTVNSKNDVVVGSAHYLSPEQARGGYTDLRSDIYSLGVVMYEMFTGKLPFDGEESVSVVMQHLNDEPVAPREVNPDLSAGIEAIILKAMKKEQRLRYSNAAEILEDLVLVYQNPSISASQLNASSAAAASQLSEKQGHSSASRSTNKGSRKKKKKKKTYLMPLFIALAVLIMVAAAFFFILKPLLFPDMGEDVKIPNLIGMTLAEAQREAELASTEDVEFTVVEGHYEHSESEKDTIIDQTPAAGGSVKRSREITVVISKGNIALELEDYTGMEYEEVKEELEKLGVKVEKKEASNDEYESGVIFNQNPREGTQMAIGDTVTLHVSEGVKSTVVPNLINLTREEALSAAEGSKLVVTVKEEPSSKYDIGKVSYQSIDAFESVPVGTEIIIHISTGKKDSDEEEEKDNKQEEEEKTEENEKEPSPPTPQKKSVSVTLSNLPKDRETVSVRLVHDGQTYYEKDFSTAQGSATISIETDKDLSLDVYYDGTYITTKEVKY